MQTIPVFLIIRIVVGLVIGVLTARKLKGVLRALVVQCMPMKYRISSKSFYVQTRITTIISIFLVVGIAIAANELLVQAGTSLGIVETSVIRPIPPKPVKQKIKPIASVPDIKASDFQTAIPAIQPTVPTPQSTAIPQTYSDQFVPRSVQEARPVPESFPAQTSAILIDRPVYLSEQFFVQVAAFTSLSKAETARSNWSVKESQRCWIALDDRSYKILLGPFANTDAARKYIRSRKLKGFPRSGVQLRFLRE